MRIKPGPGEPYPQIVLLPDRKRDFIERAAIAAMQGLLTNEAMWADWKAGSAEADIYARLAANHARALWDELEKVK